MGLADFKARLLLFLARKLREWANSIDRNVPPLPQPTSVVSEEHVTQDVTQFGAGYRVFASAPPQQATQGTSGPPQHWVELVQEKAPELLSLMAEHSLAEDSPAENHFASPAWEDPSHPDAELETASQRPVNAPAIEADPFRKSQARPLQPRKAGRQRIARNLAKVAALAWPKHLTLKPLTEANAPPKPPEYAMDQGAEPPKPTQLIELSGQDQSAELFRVPLPERTGPGSEDKEDQIPTREALRRPGPQEPRSHEVRSDEPAIYGTPQTRPATISARQATGEPDVKRKAEILRPVFDAVEKAESGPSRANRPANFPLDSSVQDFSHTAGVVRSAESSKSQPPVEPATSSSPVIKRRTEKGIPVVFPRLRTQETATHQASPPSRARVLIKDVTSAPRLPSIAAFPRSVNRPRSAAKTRLQESAVNMPELMDEEKMNRAASVHVANLGPGENPWPDLPPATSTEMADELAAREREIDRLRRLEQEQRGTPWNV